MKYLVILLCINWSTCLLAQSKFETMKIVISGFEVHYKNLTKDIDGDTLEYIDRFDTMTFSIFGSALHNWVQSDTLIINVSPPEPYNVKSVFNMDTTRLLHFSIFRGVSHPRGSEEKRVYLADVPLVNTDTSYSITLDSSALAGSGFTYFHKDGYAWGNGDQNAWSRVSTGRFFSGAHASIIYNKSLPADVHDASKKVTLAVYPNPVHDELHVVLPETAATSLSLYDMFGKEVFVTTAVGETRLDVSKVHPGMYVLSAGNQRRKILVQ